MHPNKHITSFLTHPFISQTKKSLCRVDCCINLSQYYLSLLGRKTVVGIPGEVEWGCDRSGSARVGHAGGAAQSRQFIINNNVGKYQRVWGITTGARRAQRRSNGATPEKRTAADRWRKKAGRWFVALIRSGGQSEDAVSFNYIQT